MLTGVLCGLVPALAAVALESGRRAERRRSRRQRRARRPHAPGPGRRRGGALARAARVGRPAGPQPGRACSASNPGFVTERALVDAALAAADARTRTRRRMIALLPPSARRDRARCPARHASAVATTLPLTRQRHRRRLRRSTAAPVDPGDAHVGRVLRRQPGLFLDDGHSGWCAAAASPSATTSDAPEVIVINETMAAKYWPGEDPIGKRVTISYNNTGPREIVGIVGDVKQTRPHRRGRAADVHAVRPDAVAVPGGGRRERRRRRKRRPASLRAGARAARSGCRRPAKSDTARRSTSRGRSRRRASRRCSSARSRAGAAAGRLRPVRRDGVLGGAAQPRDRHPHGARRAGRPTSARWSCRRRCGSARRAGVGLAGALRGDARARQPAVRRHAPPIRRRSPPCARRCSPCCCSRRICRRGARRASIR